LGTGVLIGPRRVFAENGQADAATGLTEPEEALWTRLAGQEAGGSPNVIGAVALHAAMDTLGDIGWPAITAHEHRIAASMRRGLAAIPGVHVLGPGPDTETLPVATFTVTGVPHALVAARLAAEHAIGVGHSRFGVDRYLIRLLGLTSEDVRRHRDQAQRGDRRAVPGAVRASAGINVTDDDVQRLLAAVASVAVGDPPVPYCQDPSTGDFFPAVSTFPERAAWVLP
jgi:selenocysteine lyase/cysteine desulfurase